jgi:CubicO group peptidase (beta-lactamase class C family)
MERVERLADRLVAAGEELGLQVAAYLHGKLVVDVQRGVAPDALIHSFSTGKGVASTVLHVLAERGVLDYDAAIADYWPEFGKPRATVRHLLTHSVGVPYMPAGVTVEEACDWDRICARIADLEPVWEPGTKMGYHGWTYGWIAGEVVRRATGRTISQVLREDVAGPLGVADELFFGVPEAALGRVVPLVEVDLRSKLDAFMPPDAPFWKVCPPALAPSAELANRADVLTADMPAVGTMSARAVARMYAALLGEVDGVRLISPERLAQVSGVALETTDQVFGNQATVGLGYFLGLEDLGGTPACFGMSGSGGSTAGADAATGFAWAFTHNRVGFMGTVAEAFVKEIRADLGL